MHVIHIHFSVMEPLYLLTISKRYQQPVDILGVGGVPGPIVETMDAMMPTASAAREAEEEVSVVRRR